MDQTCACGMTAEHSRSRPGCPDCGMQLCGSCGVQLDATTYYCRWCAASLGASRAA